MTDTLIQRLREDLPKVGERDHQIYSVNPASVVREAADTIEQQAAEIALRRGERVRLESEIYDAKTRIEQQAAQIAEKDAEIARLRLQVKQADERGDEALRRAHAGEAEVEALRAYAERLNWLHSPNSNDVDGYEWGIYRVKWAGGKPVEIWQTLSDFSDLDAALRQEQPT